MTIKIMMNENDIKKEVLRRVRFVYFTRKYLQPVYIELSLIVVLLVWISSVVSLKHVFLNMSQVGLGSIYNFLAVAFLNTQLTVQIISCAMLVVAVLFVRDIVKQFGGSTSSTLGLKSS